MIDFRSQTKVSLLSSVLGGVTGIGLAYGGFGVWALVLSGLVVAFVRSFLLLIYNRWVPVFRFSFVSFQELFGFGWKMMASSILDSIWKQLYQVVVGKYYSPASLGQYTRATGFSQLFSSNLTVVVQRVTYPVLSSIQDDRTRMVSAYRKIIKTTMFITAVSMFFLGAISEPLLYCLIGPQWHDAAIYLTIICISESTYPLHSINLNMLEVQGRSDLFLGLEIIKKIMALLPLFIGVVWGILPMLYVNLLFMIVAYFLNSHFSGKLIGYSSWMQIKDIAPSYGIAMFVALLVFFLKYLPLSNWIILPIQLAIGIISFLLICQFSNVEEFRIVKNIITQGLGRKKDGGIC
jgi:O-antigen/teichoic acid export membrane protein